MDVGDGEGAGTEVLAQEREELVACTWHASVLALWGYRLSGVLKETAGPEAPTDLTADPRPSLAHSGSWVGTLP